MNEQLMGAVLEQLGVTLKDIVDAIKRLEGRIDKLEAKTSFVMVGPVLNQPPDADKPIKCPTPNTGDRIPPPNVVIS